MTILRNLWAIGLLATMQTEERVRWVSYTVPATGLTEAKACAAARRKAAMHAQRHLALNIGACRCEAAAEGLPRSCRLAYEVLETAK